jgi:hypothetical protein
VFVGFNQFRETVVFGAALMYDETFESFKWLFNAFLSIHNKNSLKQFLLIKIVQWERQCLGLDIEPTVVFFELF